MPKEDENITTQSLFKVTDKDTGEVLDVRELLGITEEDFRENPELYEVMMQMKTEAPVDDGVMEFQDTKARLRKYQYDIIGFDEDTGQTAALVDGEETVNWAEWWAKKDRNNKKLVEAIRAQNLKAIKELLNE